MRSSTVAALGLAAAAQAARFTNTDFNIEAGSDFEITWEDAEGEAVISLKRGDPGDLDTVEEIITMDGADGSYTWSVPDTYESGDDYAFEIIDESGDGTPENPNPNYSIPFSLEGDGSAAPSETPSSTVTTTTTTSAAPSSTEDTSSTTESAEESSTTEEPSSTSSEASSTTSDSAPSQTPDEDEDEDDGDAPSDNKAGHLGSPVALIGFTIAALLYFQ